MMALFSVAVVIGFVILTIKPCYHTWHQSLITCSFCQVLIWERSLIQFIVSCNPGLAAISGQMQSGGARLTIAAGGHQRFHRHFVYLGYSCWLSGEADDSHRIQWYSHIQASNCAKEYKI